VGIRVEQGDSREVLKTLADNSVDSCATDPPYALVSIIKRFGKSNPDNKHFARTNPTSAYRIASAGFMGKTWDTGETAFDPEFWREVFRVLKPGAHVVAFGGTRSYHRLACAIEDAGFEIRDCLMWHFGSGFPKSHDASKAIDHELGLERAKVRIDGKQGRQLRNPKATGGGRDGMPGAIRPYIEAAKERGYHEAVSPEAVSPEAEQWNGWGTALKPATEIICLARKPLSEKTVAANVLKWGTGAINIDGCRIETTDNLNGGAYSPTGPRNPSAYLLRGDVGKYKQPTGRWPANLLHDGSDEVVGAFPESQDGVAVQRNGGGQKIGNTVYSGSGGGLVRPDVGYGGSGSAARFFYTAKADATDRHGSKHPTVKPIDLMRWLVRLVTRRGGVVLDPFAGTGTTGIAAWAEGCDAILIEREAEYVADIKRRLEWAQGRGPDRLSILAKRKPAAKAGPLFADEHDGVSA